MELNRTKAVYDFNIPKVSLFPVFKEYKQDRKPFFKDAERYDYVAERGPRVKHPIEAVLHLMQCCVSGGLFSMHEAFMVCGIWMATILTFLLGVVMCLCNWMLVDSARRTYGRVKSPTLTYATLFEASMKLSAWPLLRNMAPAIRVFVEVQMALLDFTSNVIMTVLIARCLKGLLEFSVTLERPTNNSTYYILPVYIVPICILNILFFRWSSVKFLAPMTVVANLYIVMMTFFTIYGSQKWKKIKLQDFAFSHGITDIYRFLSLAIYAISNITVTLDVESNMTQPKYFLYVNIAGSAILSTLLSLVGFFGHWAFGNACSTPITVQYPFKPTATFLRVFMCIILFNQCIYNFSSGFFYVWPYLKKIHKRRYWFWRQFYTVLFFVIISGIACGLNDVVTIMALLGSLGVTPCVFIYPAVIETLVYWEHPGLGKFKWRLLKNIVMVAFGVNVFVCSTIFTIINAFS